jgi:hypothetical protein
MNRADLGLTREDMEFTVDLVLAESDVLHAKDGPTIKAFKPAWSIRHDPRMGYSVGAMTHDEICETVVEELLNVRYWETQGKTMDFFPADLFRFIGLQGDLVAMVRNAFTDPRVREFVQMLPDGQIRVHPDKLKDAMDFAGVYHEDHLPPKARAVG